MYKNFEKFTLMKETNSIATDSTCNNTLLVAGVQGVAVNHDSHLNYEEALRYANNLLRRVGVRMFTPKDIVSEGFCTECFCKAKMRAFVLNEKRRNKTSVCTEKKCTQCKNIKTVAEFYTRTDYRVNYKYQIQPCIDCHKLNYNETKKKK